MSAPLKWFFLVCLSLTMSPIYAQFLRVYYPDIEQGAATLVVAPTGNAVLIDGGSGLRSSDAPIESFINDLIDQGIVTSLDSILATHYDEDHIGRLENVFQLVPLAPGLITYDRGTFGGTPSTFAYGDYSFYADLNNRTTLTPTTTIAVGGGVTVRCYVVNGMLPDSTSVDLSSAPQFENAVSAAFVVSYGDVDIWIGGDLVGNTANNHPPVEQAVAPFVGDVDIYTVDHHGSSATSSDASFLATLAAEVAINQNSVENNFGHPNAIVVNRFKATNDSFGNTPLWFQTNPGDPTDTRSDDTLADGIADPDDITDVLGLPGNITLISDGGSYQLFGGNIEPVARLADSGVHTLADFPPAILLTTYAPLVPLASETVTVEAEIRDEGAVSVRLLYEVNDVAQLPVTMTEIGTTGRYQGTLPAQTDGSKVAFRVEATDNALQVSQSSARGYFSGTSTIAQLRQQNASGVLLTKEFSARVQGNITAEPGLFNSSVSQIWVQDATGGLNIFDNQILPLVRGDLVEFVGEIEQFGGIAEIITAEDIGNYGFTFQSSGAAPAPAVITLSQLDETVEGSLIRVNNVTISSGSIPENGNANLLITDDGGTTLRTLRIDGDTDIPGANTPTGSFDIIGIANQFDSSVPLDFGYQVLPRERTDFISEEVNHPVVLISEIHADPDASLGDANGDGTVSTSQDEFIELVNTSFQPVDIGGYTLADAVGIKFTFPLGTVIPAREATVVFSGGTPTGSFGNAAANGLVFTADSALGLNNSGDTITFADDSAVAVQVVVYGGEGGDNQSLVRDPDWTNAPLVKHTTTASGLRYSPGTRIDGSAYTLAPGLLLLSEVLYDPSGADGGKEWIELINVSTGPIDLSDVSIGSGGNDYTGSVIQLSGVVAAGETFVVGGPESDNDNGNPTYDQVFQFSPGIQNSGSTADGVALFNVRATQITSAVVPIDAVVYGTTNSNNLIDETGVANPPEVGDASSGASIERTTLAGDWQIQGLPTPNNSPLVGEPPMLGDPEDIILTEVFYDRSGSDNGFEWIEIHNTGEFPVNLAAMSIGAGGGDYTNSTAPLGGTIPAGATWVIGGPSTDATNGMPTYDLVVNFSPDLQNSGSDADGVALFGVPEGSITPATVPVDAVVYGPANNNNLIDETGAANLPEVGDAPAGSTIERINLEGDWQIQGTPDPNQITFSTETCTGIDLVTTVSIPIAGGQVDIRYGTQNLNDGDTFMGDDGDAIQWRLSVNGFNGPWKNFTISCDEPVLEVTGDDYCDTAIDIPITGGQVDVRYGPQNLEDGHNVFLPKGINVQWRLSVNGFNGPWNTQAVGSGGCTIAVTGDHYCDTAIDIPIAGGQVDVRYGPQNLVDGNNVFLPKGINVQWRLSVNGFNGPWNTQAVGSGGCTIAVTGDHYCDTAIDIPIAGGQVDVRYGPQNLEDGNNVFLPKGINVQWRLSVNGFNGPWNTQAVGSSGCTIAVTTDHYCDTAIDIPIAGGQVDVRYGPQNLEDGNNVFLPKGINVQWRLSVNGFNGPWNTQAVGSGGCTIAVTGDHYCDTAIDIPIAGGQVDVRYGPQNLVDGNNVFLPKGINVQWRLSVNGFNGPWKTQAVDSGGCTIAVTGDHYCDTAIDIPIPGGQVDVRYGPQNLEDSDTVFLPKGINIQWRLSVNGFNGPWQTQAVGSGGCLISVTGDHYCHMAITIPPGSELDIRYGPQNLANGAMVYLPKAISIQWRLDNGAWQTQVVGSNGCAITAP